MQSKTYVVCRVTETDDKGHPITKTTLLSAYSNYEAADKYAYEIGKIVGDEVSVQRLTNTSPIPDACHNAVSVYLVTGVKCDYYIDTDKYYYYCVYELDLFNH